MPESVRYLQSKGLKEQAVKSLKRHGLLIEPIGDFTLKENKKYSFVVSFTKLWSKEFRARTILLWTTWAVLVYTYHGIFIWLPSIYVEITQAKEIIGPLYWVLIITLFQIPGYYSATFLLDNLGRRTVLAIYLTIAGVGALLFSISYGLQAILISSAIVSFFNLGAWAALYTYTPELYPTSMRGTGAGSAASIGRLAGIAAPALTGYIWSIWGLSIAFVVFAVVHIINAIVVGLFRIETKGRTLEEISS
jgi:putative MFS transporter